MHVFSCRLHKLCSSFIELYNQQLTVLLSRVIEIRNAYIEYAKRIIHH